MGIVSFAWIAAVEATPASQRPFVGSSTDNTQLGLTFEYNGFGRVEGQAGGPGQTRGKPGARVPLHVEQRVDAEIEQRHRFRPVPPRSFPPSTRAGRERNPIPFGGSPGVFRLFGVGLGDQAAWILPFALIGLLAALLLWLLETRRPEATEQADAEPAGAAPPRGRRDPRLAVAIVFGGWLLVEAFVLSSSKGIVHPYYVSALAPGVGAMTGVGAWALWRLCRRRMPAPGLVLAAGAVAATVACEIVLMHRHDWMRSFAPVLAVGAAACLAVLLAATLLRRERIAAGAIGLAVALLLVVPTGYATTTWLAPVEATFPAAGPKAAAGDGGFQLNARDLAINRAIAEYVRARASGMRFELLTVAADTASPFIFWGMHAAALAGYSGVDPVMDGKGLARLVRRGEARYVLLGGEYSTRGGNGATQAALRACAELAPFQWGSPVDYPFGLVLLDCAGRARELEAG
jgi:4-amino-4-deoxy-L-arabinose transferase-like glycosyltransferase